MTTSVPRNDAPGQAPGPWWTVWRGDVYIRCPGGHRVAYDLGPEGHSIDPSGVVNPSTVCPDAADCWHVWAVLIDWDPGLLELPTCEACGHPVQGEAHDHG